MSWSFSALIENHIMEKYPDAVLYELTDEDHRRINELVEKKYKTWEWNFGYSPQYSFSKILRTMHSGTMEFNLDVRDGIIRQIKIYGDYFNKFDTEDIEQALVNLPHRESEIRKVLNKYRISDYFNNLTVEEFMEGIF